jgi:hypothetical protein
MEPIIRLAVYTRLFMNDPALLASAATMTLKKQPENGRLRSHRNLPDHDLVTVPK